MNEKPRPRDRQKTRLHRAERIIATSLTWNLYFQSSRFEKFKDFVWCIGSRLRKEGFAIAYVRVKDGRFCQSPFTVPEDELVGFPRHSRATWAVCHELAHLAHTNERGGRYQAPHGPEFCAFYLEIVKRIMGDAAHIALYRAYIAEGVRCSGAGYVRNLVEERRELYEKGYALESIDKLMRV